MNIVGIFGPTEQEEAVSEAARSSLRAEILKKIALGGSWSVGAAVVYGVIEFLRSDPHDAFPMLKSWGPWAIFGLAALFVVYDIAKIMLNTNLRQTHAFERLAVAVDKLASKDDRQTQEMQTLTAYTAQQSEKLRDRQEETHRAVERMTDLLIEMKKTTDDRDRARGA